MGLLTQAKISIEVPATSGLKPFLTLQTVPVHMILFSESMNGPIFVEGLVAAIAISSIMWELWQMWSLGFLYPSQHQWYLWDWACNIIFLYSFANRFMALYYVQDLSAWPRTTPFPSETEFISFAYAFRAVTEYNNSMSLNVILAWLKTFKYLQFVPFMRVLIRTIGSSVAQVSTFLILSIVITVGFAMAFHLALGHELQNLRSLSITSLSLYRMLMGLGLYNELYESDRSMGPLLYYGWTLVIFLFVSLILFLFAHHG